jgi:O-antigen ligase
MNKRPSYLHFTGAAGAVLLPFAFVWLSPVYGLIVLALGVLAAAKWSPRVAHLLLFGAFLDWQILSVFWSENRAAGWADVVMILPIGVMGLLMSAVVLPDGKRWAKRWAETFAWATVAAWTLIFLVSLYNSGWVNYKNFELGGRLGLHFQSLYLVVAALILERRVWRKTYGLSVVRGLAVLWLLFGVIFLSSRIHLILVPVFLVARFAELAWNQPQYRSTIVRFATAVVLIMGAFVAVLPGPRGRLVDLRNELRSIDGEVDGKQTNHRVFLWKYGTEIAMANPIIGVGNGAGEDLLNEKLKQCDATFYRKKEPYYLYEFRYDFHNIWLQSWAEGGIVAVAILILMLGWGIYHGSGALRYAWVLVALSGTTESLLDKQAGALLITFLVGLTALSLQTKKEQKELATEEA